MKIFFFDYESSPHNDFNNRLLLWLDNVADDEDQKTLFKLVERIFYVGREEFVSLNKTAYESVAKRWLFDNLNINVENKDIDKLLLEAIKSTWFCPLSDSCRISQFYHVNQVASRHTFRPDWLSLKLFGNLSTIKDYINRKNVKYLILLEDFLGSGTQAIESLKLACSIDEDLKILFIPFILCPQGYDFILDEMKAFGNFEMKSLVLLKQEELINKSTALVEKNKIFVELVERLNPSVVGKAKTFVNPYGFKSTGALTVMFTNAPNNTLPIILFESDSWNPLFKRHSR